MDSEKTKPNLALGKRRVARVLEFVGARLLLGRRLVAFVNVFLERLELGRVGREGAALLLGLGRLPRVPRLVRAERGGGAGTRAGTRTRTRTASDRSASGSASATGGSSSGGRVGTLCGR